MDRATTRANVLHKTLRDQPTSLGVFTINLWGPESGDPEQKRVLLRSIFEKAPDFVFVQEAPLREVLEDACDGTGYKVQYYIEGHNRYEIMAALSRTTSSWSIDDTETLKSDECIPTHHRYAHVSKITDGVSTKRIANVHLCGGMYDEIRMAVEFESSDGAAAAKGYLARLVAGKTDLLRKCARADADVILGDFNSDMNVYMFPTDQERRAKVVDYFKGPAMWAKIYAAHASPPSAEVIERRALEYARAPYRFLQEADYIPVWDDQIKETHLYGQTPDAIWYRPYAIHAIRRQYWLPLNERGSDHSPVGVVFTA
jgi:endonuclease/exonuclease/phosphatase family metal-dependent hydrolase